MNNFGEPPDIPPNERPRPQPWYEILKSELRQAISGVTNLTVSAKDQIAQFVDKYANAEFITTTIEVPAKKYLANIRSHPEELDKTISQRRDFTPEGRRKNGWLCLVEAIAGEALATKSHPEILADKKTIEFSDLKTRITIGLHGLSILIQETDIHQFTSIIKKLPLPEKAKQKLKPVISAIDTIWPLLQTAAPFIETYYYNQLLKLAKAEESLHFEDKNVNFYLESLPNPTIRRPAS